MTWALIDLRGLGCNGLLGRNRLIGLSRTTTKRQKKREKSDNQRCLLNAHSKLLCRRGWTAPKSLSKGYRAATGLRQSIFSDSTLFSQVMLAEHSTSTRAPSAKPLAPKALRAGYGFSNIDVQTSLKVAHSPISANITVQRIRSCNDRPFATKIDSMFRIVCSASARIPPTAKVRVPGREPSWPDKYSTSP